MADTLCWRCGRACGGKGCIWADKLKPRSDWDAVPRTIGGNGVVIKTFHVKSCPGFLKEGKKK